MPDGKKKNVCRILEDRLKFGVLDNIVYIHMCETISCSDKLRTPLHNPQLSTKSSHSSTEPNLDHQMYPYYSHVKAD